MQQELLTNSGVSITMDATSPHRDFLLGIAASALGGIVAEVSTTHEQNTVLDIIAQNTIGTVLTDEYDGKYELMTNGKWVNPDGHEIAVPPYEIIVSATMPGGWSWRA